VLRSAVYIRGATTSHSAGLTVRGPIPGSGKRYFSSQKVRICSAANPTAQPMGTEGIKQPSRWVPRLKVKVPVMPKYSCSYDPPPSIPAYRAQGQLCCHKKLSIHLINETPHATCTRTCTRTVCLSTAVSMLSQLAAAPIGWAGPCRTSNSDYLAWIVAF
jgi:hypothetical protein